MPFLFAEQFEKFGMNAWVIAELRVKGSGHNFPLPDKNGMSVAFGENFNAGTCALDSWSADVNLLQRFGAEFGGERHNG